MVCSDDHEVANDYAGDHRPTASRPSCSSRAARPAYQAYYEHLPLPRRMLPRGPWQFMYTQRAFGDLVNLFMLDGRQYRSHQACAPGPLVEPCPELYDPQRTMLGVGAGELVADARSARAARAGTCSASRR